MFINGGFFKGKIYKLKIALVLIALVLVTGAHGKPIIQNQVEDPNILISQFVGGQPDVLIIQDLSGSMMINYGGTQIGNWDNTNAITSCEGFYGTRAGDGTIQSSHCAENTAGTDVCGSINCQDGICDDQTSFHNELNCIQQQKPSLNMCPTLQNASICGGGGLHSINSNIIRTITLQQINSKGECGGGSGSGCRSYTVHRC
jgi:hypothetical protein